MNNQFKLSAITSSLLVAAAMTTTVAANENEDQYIEEVVAKGFRTSLMKGRDLKKDAIGTQDSIVADDIADFPDLNLAEALQRVPGVAITRDGGEGRRIALRGLDSNFSLVQLNGMDVLGNTDTAMDSRSQGSRDRAFDFNLFAAEMFSQINVQKTFAASSDEGGMAGTVGLRTAKPFDYEGFNAAASAQAGTNQYTDNVAPRTALMISNTWGNFGALASVAYSQRDTEEKGANTYRWRMRKDDEGADKAPGSIRGAGVSQSDFDAITSGNVISPRGNRYSVWQNDQERIGVTTALQFKMDKFELVGDFLYGELTNNRNEYHINPRNNEGSMPYGRDVTINEVDINDMNELVYADYSNTVINTESRQHDVTTEFTQAVLNARWDITDKLTLRALVGTETSDLDTNSFKFYAETRGDVTVDYRADRHYGQYNYAQDMTDASRWWFQEVDVRTELTESENTTAKLDLEYFVNDTDELKFGVSQKTLENTNVRVDVGNIMRGSSGADNDNSLVASVDQGIFTTLDDSDDISWAVVDVRQVINRYDEVFNVRAGQEESFNSEMAKFNALENGRAPASIGDSTNSIEEDTTNAYVEYQWDRTLGNMPFRGNVGVRYYETEIDVQVTENTTFSNAYDGLLPSMNLVLEVADDVFVRSSVSQNITRPSYGDLSYYRFRADKEDARLSNAELEPYKSNNYDLSVEWYFDDVGYIAAAYYRKDIEDYITRQGFTAPFRELGLEASLIEDTEVTMDTPIDVTRSENTDEATLQGLELSFQRDFDFLPAPFNNMGVVSQFTFSDGSVNQYSDGEGLGEVDFPNLSDHTNSITLYYETETWGARIAQTYRSEYISGVGLASSDEDVRGFHATRFWDFSAFYQVSDKLKLTVEGSNLSNEREEQFSDSSDRAYNTTTSGRTVFVGASYKF